VRTDRDLTRTVRSWLEEGVTALPDRVLDDVLDQLPATRQRRAKWWWPAPRLFGMNKAVTLGIAAAAVVIVAMLGIRFLAVPGPSVGGPAQEPTPTPAVNPMALVDAPGGELAAGTYIVDDPFPVRITFDVPPGWFAEAQGQVELGVASDPGRGISLLIVDNVVVDPCDASRAQLDPPVGPSVEDLVNAISNLPGFEATDVIDITLDGFDGKQFEVTAPDGAGLCQLDGAGLGTWSTEDRTNGVGPGEVNVLRILDVDGVRLMIAGAYHPADTSADELAELQRIMDSIRLGP